MSSALGPLGGSGGFGAAAAPVPAVAPSRAAAPSGSAATSVGFLSPGACGAGPVVALFCGGAGMCGGGAWRDFHQKKPPPRTARTTTAVMTFPAQGFRADPPMIKSAIRDHDLAAYRAFRK